MRATSLYDRGWVGFWGFVFLEGVFFSPRFLNTVLIPTGEWVTSETILLLAYAGLPGINAPFPARLSIAP